MFLNFRKSNSRQTDEWLIAQFRDTGDLEFLGTLYERYMHLVFGLCLKYLKDREASRDATMQIFEKLVVEIPKREIENFKPWLHVLTKNYCLMHLRAEKTKTSQQKKMWESEAFLMESATALHHNDEGKLEEDLEVLKKCIDQLKSEQKECVNLFYIEEKCYQEIADLLDIELKKVKSHIQNGKRNLKICMENHG